MNPAELKSELEKLEAEFSELEDDPNQLQLVVERLKALHKAVLETNQEALLMRFETEAGTRFGGIYVPYLLWGELARFVFRKEESRRESIQKLIHAFATGYFEENTQRLMKPLLIIYFYYEYPLKIREFQERYLKHYHPVVQDYFRKLIQYKAKNPRTTVILFHKFERIHPLFPDFDLFDVPLDILEEKYPRAVA